MRAKAQGALGVRRGSINYIANKNQDIERAHSGSGNAVESKSKVMIELDLGFRVWGLGFGVLGTQSGEIALESPGARG